MLVLSKEKKKLVYFLLHAEISVALTKIQVHGFFYFRNLCLYEFCAHDMKSDSAEYYTYDEGFLKRGFVEICCHLWMQIEENNEYRCGRPEIDVRSA